MLGLRGSSRIEMKIKGVTMRTFAGCLLAVVVLFLLSPFAQAQERRGGVRGKVTDNVTVQGSDPPSEQRG